MGAAAGAEEQYKQAGHAAADQAEAGADKLTQQVGPVLSVFMLSIFTLHSGCNLCAASSHAGVPHCI